MNSVFCFSIWKDEHFALRPNRSCVDNYLTSGFRLPGETNLATTSLGGVNANNSNSFSWESRKSWRVIGKNTWWGRRGSDHHIRSDQSLSRVRLFATPWIAARQASLSITNPRSSPRLTSIESVMPSSHLILCPPLLLLPPIPPSIRVFSNESTLCMRWPK